MNLCGAMPRRPTGLPEVVVEIAVWIGEITGLVEREKFPADVPDGRWSGEACVGESLLCEPEVGELAFIVSVIEARGSDASGLSAVGEDTDSGGGDKLMGSSLDPGVGVDGVGESREEVLRERRWRCEFELAIQQSIGAFDIGFVDAGNGGEFLKEPWQAFEATGGEDAGGCDGFDRAPTEEIALPGVAKESRSAVMDRCGEFGRTHETGDFAKTGTERLVVSGTRLRAVVPFAKACELALCLR